MPEADDAVGTSDVSLGRIKVFGAVAAVVVVVFIGTVWLVIRSSRPAALVAKLRHAKGEAREELVMRLNLSRGDVVTPMVAAFRDREGEAGFRVDMLDLLFKKNNRASDEKIEVVLREALSDAEPAVRRAAVEGFAVYLGGDKQLAVLDLLDDADAEVRREVYMLLTADRGGWGGRRGGRRGRGHRHGGDSLWELVSEEARADLKAKVLATARRRAGEETDAELKLLARAVVGREVEALCNQATEAAQRSDVAGAEDLFRKALELDPESHQARIRFARHVLAQGEQERALALAKEYGALVRIPMLPSAPVVDGDPADPAWEKAYVGETCFRGTSRWVAKPTEGRMTVRVGHAGGRVYVAVLGHEDQEGMDKLVVKHTARDSDVWRDDCVELFFDPTLEERRAFQFVINAGGAIFDLYGWDKRRNFDFESGAQVFRDRGYWGCEFSVAAKELNDAKIAPDSIWGLNVARTRIGPASEQGSLWPTYGNSHRYDLYPLAVFEFPEGAAPAAAPAPAPEAGADGGQVF